MAGNIWWSAPMAVRVPHPRVPRWFAARMGQLRGEVAASAGAAHATAAPNRGSSSTAVARKGTANENPGSATSRRTVR
jgi:hypothetical protein